MKLKVPEKETIFLILGNFFIVFLFTFLFYFQPFGLKGWIHRFENLYYDFYIRYTPRDWNLKKSPIVIVDVDDESLEKEGRWPWSRIKTATLTANIFKENAKIVVFDMVFSEPQDNPIDVVIEGGGSQELEILRDQFDADLQFSEALKKGTSILGFAFTLKGTPQGELPAPLFKLNDAQITASEIPNMKSYIANLKLLEDSSRGGGFINSSPSSDGVIRSSPLLLRMGKDVYGSLGLRAAMEFLSEKTAAILYGDYKGEKRIEGIRLSQTTIPTNSNGAMLIPFTGPSYSFPYLSATRVLKGEIPSDFFKGKLVFIGSSATANGDLVSVPIAPVFPGVEVSANVAEAIIRSDFLFAPAWGHGASIALLLLLGLATSLVLPFMGPISSTLWIGGWQIFLFLADYFLWKWSGIYISFIFPIFCLAILYVLDLGYGFLFETQKKSVLKRLFGQYVPPEYIDTITSQGIEEALSGETKVMSVLFADIRGFTSFSENLTAQELKQFLSTYLTLMTEAIFEHKGTIDKYVGDLIMAFWGAPVEDPEHAFHAVETALAMQEKLREFNLPLEKEKKPQVKIGIGINTGMMNVGDMGSKFRRAYTVLGDAVNFASRLESLTKYYSVDVLVGEESWKQTQNQFFYRKIDRVKVKGKERAIDLYQPVELKKKKDCEEEFIQFEKALNAYFLGKWDLAEEMFKQIEEKNPKLTHVFLERIKLYKVNPPKDWEGTYTFETK